MITDFEEMQIKKQIPGNTLEFLINCQCENQEEEYFRSSLLTWELN